MVAGCSGLQTCSPPLGTIERVYLLSAGSIPFGHSTSGYSHSPPLGTVGCYIETSAKDTNWMIWERDWLTERKYNITKKGPYAGIKNGI